MTIVSVDEMWSRKTSSIQSADGKTFTANYASAYQVVHSADATEDEIKAATGLPRLRSSYSSAPAVFCTNLSVSKSGPIYSIVEVTWSGEFGPNGEGDSPVNIDPVISYSSTTSTEPTDTDGAGYPLTNVNGDVVEGFSKEVSDMVLEVTRNYMSVSGKLALRYMDSTNSDTMNVFGDAWEPGSAALQSFRISPVIQEGVVKYFSVSASILFRQAFNTVPARAHWHRYRNEGLNERTGVKVAFSGGSGTGAAGYASTNPAGEIVTITMTNRGRGYTSAPTIAITTTAGATGTGATATCTIDADGKVATTTVTAPGSAYKSRLVPAVDGNKERVTKPVLLKYDGTREEDADSATWIERPKKSYSLPYSVLGLL